MAETKTHRSVGEFKIVLEVTLIIALWTVSYQAIKAALVNPVKSLKSE